MSEFHAKVPQATASEGLAKGPYMVARAAFEPTILLTKGAESTNEPPRPLFNIFVFISGKGRFSERNKSGV